MPTPPSPTTSYQILLISPEAWGPNFVSKHHYATTLARAGHTVWFLNPPGKPFSVTETPEGVRVVDYQPLFRGLGRMPAWLSAWLTRWEFLRLQSRAGTRWQLLWNFDSSRFFNLSRLPATVYKICHLVDLNQDIQRPLLAATSHLCLGTTRYIVAELARHNANSHLLGHGYQPPAPPDPAFQFAAPGTNPVKAFYVGNLSMAYIDWDILYRAALAYPHIDFVFVGPEGKSNLAKEDRQQEKRQQLKALSNTHFVGPVAARHIPQVLHHASLLLVAYQEVYHQDQAAPHKLLEYLASGKPVVATYTESFDQPPYREHLLMSRQNKDFVELLANYNQLRPMDITLLPTYTDRIREIEERSGLTLLPGSTGE